MIDGGLRQLFRKHLPLADWQSVETGGTGRGVPDSNYCFPNPSGGFGTEGWIEFKTTEGYAVRLRPEQIAWMCRRARRGGRVFVAVRRWCSAGPRREAADELWLVAGAGGPELLTVGLGGLTSTPRGPKWPLLGAWHGGPARWHWPAVAALLTGR